MTLQALGRRLQGLAIRTSAGPLRPIWALAHAAVIRIVATRLTHGLPGARTYLKGGFGFGRPVYGLSDVDMIVVAPDAPRSSQPEDPCEVVRERWKALAARFPTLAELFNDGEVWVYRAGDIAALRQGSYLSFGLRDGATTTNRAAFMGHEAPYDPMGLLDHPGLYGPQGEWRALRARRRHLPTPRGGPDDWTIYAWLELRFIWCYAFRTCADPTGTSAAYTCQKFVSDSARVWLWLVHREHLFVRDEILRRTLVLLPEEEQALTRALDLGRKLGERPDPPLEEMLPFLVRTSARIATHLATRAAEAGFTPVALRWDGTDDALPLVDWRARGIPGRLDQFALRPGDPGDPDRVADIARASGGSIFPALRTSSLLVLPTTEIWFRGRLRGVECETSDPVSFGLMAGAEDAAFPNLPGWSAEDSARRAVAEHRGWLRLGPAAGGDLIPYWTRPLPSPAVAELAGLFGAARAAHFATSLEQGRPEIGLTPAAIAGQLIDCMPHGRTIVAVAYGELQQALAQDSKPRAATVTALRELVRALPAYQALPDDARPAGIRPRESSDVSAAEGRRR